MKLTKCTNTTCKLRQNCFKALDIDDMYDTSSHFEPRVDSEGNLQCSMYWPIGSETSRKVSKKKPAGGAG